jgi:hypothetical protein
MAKQGWGICGQGDGGIDKINWSRNEGIGELATKYIYDKLQHKYI